VISETSSRRHGFGFAALGAGLAFFGAGTESVVVDASVDLRFLDCAATAAAIMFSMPGMLGRGTGVILASACGTRRDGRR
jgi:hypothetical protein